jgi:hypothetical protein
MYRKTLIHIIHFVPRRLIVYTVSDLVNTFLLSRLLAKSIWTLGRLKIYVRGRERASVNISKGD